jgi:hypothetical protein
VIALLELLKDDPGLYVRRSVANNLNDIGKDHPDLAVEVCRRWLVGASAEREWIVRHALRSLVKRGHRGALKLLGVSATPSVAIGKIKLLPKTVEIGGRLRFSFEITSTGRKVQELLVDYAVHFMKANGKTRPKVFKLAGITLAPAGVKEFRGALSFQQLTTRRHYPGRHRIELLVNGVAYPLADFGVRAARSSPR